MRKKKKKKIRTQTNEGDGKSLPSEAEKEGEKKRKRVPKHLTNTNKASAKKNVRCDDSQNKKRRPVKVFGDRGSSNPKNQERSVLIELNLSKSYWTLSGRRLDQIVQSRSSLLI